MLRIIGPIAVLAFVALPSIVDARGYRIDQVPGGYEFECYMCHFREPFRRLTIFGQDVRENLLFLEDYPPDTPQDFFIGDEGNADWAVLALLDSDGDGYTNGEELGDPEGLFVALGPSPEFDFTRPDLPDDPLCGDGEARGPEACDGEAFSVSCVDLGFVGGDLECTVACRVDTAGCHRCGDGVVDEDDGEACDGEAVLVGCAELGFVGGEVACTDACTVDTSGCHHCGDGVVDEGEACDGQPQSMCPDGQVGEVRCEGCVEVFDCADVPDMAVADAAGPDAVVDAVVLDAAVDAEAPDLEPVPDAEVGPVDEPDAGDVDGAVDEAMDAFVADADSPSAPSVDPSDDGGGCGLGPTSPGGPGWWLAAAIALAARRRG